MNHNCTLPITIPVSVKQAHLSDTEILKNAAFRSYLFEGRKIFGKRPTNILPLGMLFLIAIQIAFFLLIPLASLRFQQQVKGMNWLSPVVLCYGLGIVLGHLPIEWNQEVSTQIRDVSILIGIPLLLYATDIKAWLKSAGSVLLAFGLCVFSAALCSGVAGWLFSETIDNSWQLSGMLTGLYSGGILNLNAVGLSIGAEESRLLYANMADIFCGGIFLLLLTSVAHRMYGWVLPSYRMDSSLNDQGREEYPSLQQLKRKVFWKSIGLTILIAGLSVGLTFLFTGALESLSLLLLLLTTFSILASFSEEVRSWKGAFPLGEYFLLVFCVALGIMADFTDLAEESWQVIQFMAVVLTATVLLHIVLARLFGLDRDTVMITATAALYGPVFVGQVASAIRNPKLVFAGVATGLVGYAVGNYLGVLMAYFVRSWIGG
jgi:uncharacterized membrane protein